MATGSFRTSEPGAPDAALTRARLRALWGLEVRAQAREPLTTLYALVFFFLTLGYTASDAVQLVSGRGAVPTTSPWALALAFGGLTAFGQVITTMIATTAMLRDEALGTRALIATTGVSPRAWFAGRVSAALTLMVLVYLAMPVGILVGTTVRAWSETGALPSAAELTAVLAHALRAFAIITLPTMVVVTAVLAAAAVRTQRVLGVLIAALTLVALWQASLTLAGHDGTRTMGALLDPFANAPVLAATRDWTEAEKTSRALPVDTLLLGNRALWTGIAFALVAWTMGRGASHIFAPSRAAAATHAGRGADRLLRRLAAATSARQSLRLFTSGWVTLDGGWRIVSALAVLNALANAWPAARAGDSAGSILLAMHTHSRIFLILLATVYAGELVWRDRDARIAALVAALPVSSRTLVVGRLMGVLQAQLSVVVPLSLVALVLTMWADPRAGTIGTWVGWTLQTLWWPFVLLTLGSWLVHRVLDHKVGAHLLLITGWVVYTALTSRR